MIMVKIAILSLVFMSCLYIGILISKKYTNRVSELKNMKNALSMFETKIKFTYEPIPKIFEEIAKQIDGNVGKIFDNSYKMMNEKSAGIAWVDSIDEVESSMNKEDKEILKNLGKLLGKTDIEGQISEIELVDNFLNKQIELAEGEKLKNGKMYKTLGGVIGLALVIILI